MFMFIVTKEYTEYKGKMLGCSEARWNSITLLSKTCNCVLIKETASHQRLYPNLQKGHKKIKRGGALVLSASL